MIENADRIVVRDGGYNCCGPVDQQAILLTVTNRREITEFNGLIEFEVQQEWNACMCCGYPGIDWYRDKRRIALTSLQHGKAIRWKGFSGDAQLTVHSSEAIVKWLAERGITGPRDEVDATKRRAALLKEARTLIAEHVSTEHIMILSAARARSEDEVPLDTVADLDARSRLTDAHIRKAFRDIGDMYSTLFRILGCVPMHWDARLEEQDTAYEFLVRAPQEELNSAIQAAMQSPVASERNGAARLIFSQHFMSNHGKSERDIEEWMELLVRVAYENPFAENRRLVLHRLVKHPPVRAEHVLEKAVSDPDQTVRRYAIEALSVRDSLKSEEVLASVAKGLLPPRESRVPPTNYGDGTGMTFNTPGMKQETFEETDQEAAEKALQEIRR